MIAGSVLQCVVVLATITLSQQQDSCRYRYVVQPPTRYRCDPSINGQLSINCEISIGLNEEHVSIQWVLDPFSDDIPTSVLTTANRFTITSRNSSSSVFSTLTIRPRVEADIGTVYCQAVFQNGTISNPSQGMELSPFLPEGRCPSSLEDFSDRRCALSVGQTSSSPPERCLYQYSTQPQLDCNPYIGRDFADIDTGCDISFGPTQERVGVLWFFIPENSDTVTRLDDIVTKYSIVTSNFTYRIFSSLLVVDIQGSDRGTYYCQINFEDGLLGEPSQSITLQSPSAYANRPPCQRFDGQQVDRLRCALTTSMMPSPAGPTVLAKDDSDKIIIIYGVIFGVVGFVVMGLLLLVSGIYYCRVRKSRIVYLRHSAMPMAATETVQIDNKEDSSAL